MKIQIIPETAEEKQKIEHIEHSGIKEFMLFGNKIDADGQGVDVHEWSGSYRYLIGSMEFFKEVLHDERRERNTMVRKEEMMKQFQDDPKGQSAQVSAPHMPPSAPPELKVVSVDQVEAPEAPVPPHIAMEPEEDQTPSK